ncbi:DUF5719 family protein [Isoptericola sp. BMS4]|uniref:DUF5719 family protein n=1 Tax=Isoptericola sp. BMS4 TaxID=2527875 RepID=UPI00141F2155|nr:DUF5719 family protein [Isoptericola sp. BMS4]
MSARTVTAVVTGAAAAALLAAVATVGDQWVQEWTGAEQRAVAAGTRTVAVPPGEETLVCPAPASLPEGADVGDSQFEAAPVRTATTLDAAVLGAAGTGDDVRPPRTTGLGGGRAAALDDQGGDAAAARAEADGVRTLRATPVAGQTFLAAGTLASLTTQGDLRGLAAGECAVPGTSHWLVGGSTAVGATSTLVVQNPSDRPATITLDVYGPGGSVALGGGGTFTVGAHEQVTTRMESVAPEQDRLAVHVSSAGARVTASLQSQAIDGLLPVGVDLVGAGVAPRRALTVAGVVSRGEELDDKHAPRLRLLAPGDGDGTARISVYGPEGRVVLRGASTVELEAGTVTDVPLGGLPAGTYAVAVDADVPVTGAARFDRPGALPEDSVVSGTPYDVAWAHAQPAPSAGAEGAALGMVALPGDARAEVSLAGVPDERDPDVDPRGTATVTVRAYDARGAEVASRDVEVAAGATTGLPVADLTGGDGEVPVAVRVDRADDGSGQGSGQGVVWGVVLTADDGTAEGGTLVSVLAPTPATAAAGDVAVRGIDAGR